MLDPGRRTGGTPQQHDNPHGDLRQGSETDELPSECEFADVCPECYGSGACPLAQEHKPWDPQPCAACHGTGEKEVYDRLDAELCQRMIDEEYRIKG